MHNSILRLDVCIVGKHNSHNRRLKIWFPILVEQVRAEECITLHELEFENLENPDPEGSALDQCPEVPEAPGQIIECLCSAIRNVTEIDTCVGVLVSNDSKHQVWVPRAPLTSARVLSLAELLSLPAPPMKERLKLGVGLASSVLQLHETEWLHERWSKHDIYLIQGDSCQSGNPSLETPVVRHTFTPESLTPPPEIPPQKTGCDPSLFSLGIVLIELWFWRSEESFQAETPQEEDSDTARFLTAQGLLDTLNESTGIQYSSSVQHCIRGIDHEEPRLENNEFKNEVYLKVLQPLEKHLELFCGESVEEIFKKQVS